MIKPLGTPKKLFFRKNGIFRPFLIRKRSFSNMLLRKIIENFWRKLGEKILIGSDFGIFPSTKMAVSQPFLGRECLIFGTIHRINMKKVSAKFYDNNLNGSIFQNFRHTKNRPYLGNYNR